jgi:hypothetical protein
MSSPCNGAGRSDLGVLSSIVTVVLIAHVLAPRPAAAQPPLTCGQSVAGTLAAPGQQDRYTFAGAAGDVISLTLVQTSAVDPAFTVVATLVGPGTNTSRVSGVNYQSLPANGVYTVAVHDVYNTGRGSYALRLGWVLPSAKQCGDRTTLACGQEVQASIDAPLELDLFTFTGQVGNVFLLRLQDVADTDPGFQAHGRLFAPNGADLGFVATGATTTVNPPATGPYTLAIHDLGNHTRRGTYLVRLTPQGSCPPPATAPSLGVGLNATAFSAGTAMVLTGMLSAGSVPEPVDAYIYLQLPTGQTLSLQLGGGFAPGIVPIAQRFVPFDLPGVVLAQYTFTGGEPRGTYTWHAMLTTPGTMNAVSPARQVAFVVP